MDVDVLVSGHTHTYVSCGLKPLGRGRCLLIGSRNRSSRFQAVEYDGRFFVNPGSATGAWTGLWNGYVAHDCSIGGTDARVTLIRITQRADTFIRTDGHSRSSRRHLRLSTD